MSFFEEGLRRWEAEEHRNTLTGVAAAHLLSMTATCHGRDDIAGHFLQEAVAMGHRMGLYGATEDGSARTWLDSHQTWIRAASHTGWGAYCSATYVIPCSLTFLIRPGTPVTLSSHHCLHYQTALVDYPPLLPIPGELGSVMARTKGDNFESYPMPSYMGQTFNKLCELLRIAHKILWVYYDGEGTRESTPIQRVSLPFAEDLFRQLLTWSASLPLELVRAETNPHHTFILQ